MTTFIAIALVCAGLFIVTLFFHDIDFGDALDMSHDGGSSWLSLRSVLLFGVGYGAAGMLGTHAGYGIAMSTAIAFTGGLAVAALGLTLFNNIQKQESNTSQSINNLVGRTGIVTIDIVPGRTGQVLVRDENGHQGYHSAVAGQFIPAGTGCKVVDITGNALFVA